VRFCEEVRKEKQQRVRKKNGSKKAIKDWPKKIKDV